MMNEDIAPYECLKCGHLVGLSAIEPHHNCNAPLFNQDGSITKRFKAIWRKIMAEDCPIELDISFDDELI